MYIESVPSNLSSQVQVESPSNIALIKYWGKFGKQLPKNPSLSVTLDNAKSITTMSVDSSHGKLSIVFKFDGKVNEAFSNKIENFFKGVSQYFSFIDNSRFVIESTNTFPHSSGIASSASSMSALAYGLCLIEKNQSDREISKDDFDKKVSFIARLGSGSAARSIFPKMSLWGECDIEGSSNEFAIEYRDFHPCFDDINDAIAIISKGEKSVSSTAGHGLMNTHPYRETRYQSARDNLTVLRKALHEGDFDSFSDIVEIEALELHGLMMNSRPSYILMEPQTLETIRRIRAFRDQTNAKVCFTLDAGPNVHILYLNSDKELVENFLKDQILPLTVDNTIIFDSMGDGTKDVTC